MIYKGYEIKDKDYVLVEEEPLMAENSNYMHFDLVDLEWLANEYKEKEKELEESGIDFKDLKMCFIGKDYCYNPNGPDEDAESKIYLSYYRLETEKESEDRILRKMSWIDKEVADKERVRAAVNVAKTYEIEKAKKLLEENGYSVANPDKKK